MYIHKRFSLFHLSARPSRPLTQEVYNWKITRGDTVQWIKKSKNKSYSRSSKQGVSHLTHTFAHSYTDEWPQMESSNDTC